MKKIMVAHPSCSNLIKKLTRLILSSPMSIPELAQKSGVNYYTIHSWPKRNSPTLTNLESVANALGYEVCLRKKPNV